jgi:hypothetical protein
LFVLCCCKWRFSFATCHLGHGVGREYSLALFTLRIVLLIMLFIKLILIFHPTCCAILYTIHGVVWGCYVYSDVQQDKKYHNYPLLCFCSFLFFVVMLLFCGVSTFHLPLYRLQMWLALWCCYSLDNQQLSTP